MCTSEIFAINVRNQYLHFDLNKMLEFSHVILYTNESNSYTTILYFPLYICYENISIYYCRYYVYSFPSFPTTRRLHLMDEHFRRINCSGTSMTIFPVNTESERLSYFCTTQCFIFWHVKAINKPKDILLITYQLRVIYIRYCVVLFWTALYSLERINRIIPLSLNLIRFVMGTGRGST